MRAVHRGSLTVPCSVFVWTGWLSQPVSKSPLETGAVLSAEFLKVGFLGKIMYCMRLPVGNRLASQQTTVSKTRALTLTLLAEICLAVLLCAMRLFAHCVCCKNERQAVHRVFTTLSISPWHRSTPSLLAGAATACTRR